MVALLHISCATFILTIFLKERFIMETTVSFQEISQKDMEEVYGGGVVGCVLGTAGSAGLGFLAGAGAGTVTLPVIGTVSGGAFGAWSGGAVGAATFCGL
jgi:hypothetical protein